MLPRAKLPGYCLQIKKEFVLSGSQGEIFARELFLKGYEIYKLVKGMGLELNKKSFNSGFVAQEI